MEVFTESELAGLARRPDGKIELLDARDLSNRLRGLPVTETPIAGRHTPIRENAALPLAEASGVLDFEDDPAVIAAIAGVQEYADGMRSGKHAAERSKDLAKDIGIERELSTIDAWGKQTTAGRRA